MMHRDAATLRAPADVVRAFMETVRSGRDPDAAALLMAPRVLAHQVTSEEETTIARTPEGYAAHVREMIDAYGAFRIEIQELLVDGDRVYVRWRQTGIHRGVIDGFAPTLRPLVEIASAVYRVVEGKIAEYWIQVDRRGIRAQLEAAPARAVTT